MCPINKEHKKGCYEWRFLDDSEANNVDKSLWNIKNRVNCKNRSTIYYQCKGKSKFGCGAKLRMDLDLAGGVEKVATSLDHSKSCIDNFSGIERQVRIGSYPKFLKATVERLLENKIHRPKDIQRIAAVQLGLEPNIKRIYALTYKHREKMRSEECEFSKDDFVE